MTAVQTLLPSPANPRDPFVVRPAPVREPPFDDELSSRRLTVVGPHDRPLPLDLTGLTDRTQRRLRPVDDPIEAGAPDAGALPAATGPALPDAFAFSRRLVIAIIETATGRRPAGQLARHLAPSVYAGLARDPTRISRLGTAHRPAALHSVHIAEPAPEVAEVAAVVRVGQRYRAIALRLEGTDGRWRCVRLQIG